MKAKFTSQQGLSLVELIAVIAITSFIAIIIYSVLLSGEKQYNTQSSDNQELSDIAYTLKVLTKEIRKSSDVEVTGNTLVISGVTYAYSPDTKSILKDGVTSFRDIEGFSVSKNEDVITITITGKQNKTVSTKIVVRSGAE